MKYAAMISVFGCVCLGFGGISGCDDEPELPITSISYNGTLYVCPEDLISGANTVWGLQGTTTGAVSTTDGDSNTSLAVSTQGDIGIDYATKLCSDLVSHGFDDWYLPSKDELNALYVNRSTVGNLAELYYWSSTEADQDDAWLQNFADGTTNSAGKGLLAKVRCVRRNP